jgi:hypothetical protein
MRQFAGHLNSVANLAFSPDGKRLVTGGQDARARVWDIATGKRLYQIRGADGRWFASYCPDGRHILVGNDAGELWLCRAETGQIVFDLAPQRNRSIVFATPLANGKTAVSLEQTGENGSAQLLKLWDTTTGNEIRSIPIKDSYLHYANAPSGHAVSPDGSMAATVAADTTTIQLWDLDLGKLLITLKGHTGSIAVLTFSPDGKTLASGSRDTTVVVWDVVAARLMALWHLLAGDENEARQASRMLAANPKVTVPFLRERFLEAMAKEAPFARLIEDLDDDRFEVREKASRRLGEVAPAAEFALRLALLHNSTTESQMRIMRVMEKLTTERDNKVMRLVAELDGENAQSALEQLQALGRDAQPVLRRVLAKQPINQRDEVRGSFRRTQSLVQHALQHLGGPQSSSSSLIPQSTWRGLTLLERIATIEAQQTLNELTKGPAESQLARHAKAAAGRLTKPGISDQRK